MKRFYDINIMSDILDALKIIEDVHNCKITTTSKDTAPAGGAMGVTIYIRPRESPLQIENEYRRERVLDQRLPPLRSLIKLYTGEEYFIKGFHCHANKFSIIAAELKTGITVGLSKEVVYECEIIDKKEK